MHPRGNKMIFGLKRLKIHFFDQKLTPETTYRFLVKKSKVNFFDQKLSKTDARGHKSIFGQKIESSLFRPKSYQKWALGVTCRCLVQKSKFGFFNQKLTKIHFGGHKSIFG